LEAFENIKLPLSQNKLKSQESEESSVKDKAIKSTTLREYLLSRYKLAFKQTNK
jgi:hypothetical protein